MNCPICDAYMRGAKCTSCDFERPQPKPLFPRHPCLDYRHPTDPAEVARINQARIQARKELEARIGKL